MVKRFLNIIVILIFTSRLSVASSVTAPSGGVVVYATVYPYAVNTHADIADSTKTKKNDAEEKKKVKEIAKAKKLAKPEKLGELTTDTINNKKINLKLKRQRRPEGLERPPEILRRNN
jgi:hypothetical protein